MEAAQLSILSNFIEPILPKQLTVTNFNWIPVVEISHIDLLQTSPTREYSSNESTE